MAFLAIKEKFYIFKLWNIFFSQNRAFLLEKIYIVYIWYRPSSHSKLAQFFNYIQFFEMTIYAENQLSVVNKIILFVITFKHKPYCSELTTPLIFSSQRWHYNGDTIKPNNGRVYQYLSPSRYLLPAVVLSKTIQLFVCDTIVNYLELWAKTKKRMLN